MSTADAEMTPSALSLGVLDMLPQAVSIVDAADRVAYANAAFWRNLGVPPDALPPGARLRDLVRLLAYRGLYGDGDPAAHVEAVMALDRTRPVRRQVSWADGSRSFEMTSVPLPGGGFVSVAHDITALVRGREQEVARARLLESTLAGLRGGVVRFDAAMQVSLFNAAYESLIGLPGGVVRPGMTHRDIVAQLHARGEFDDEAARDAAAARMEADRLQPGTRTRERPSGRVLRFDAQPMPDGGSLTELTDVTALKRAEAEATRRAALLDAVLAAMPQGICLYGPDRRVQMFNAAYARLMAGTPVSLGESVDEVIARRLASGEYDAATAEMVRSRYNPARETFSAVRRERPNGVVLENTMARTPDGGFISVFADVTALHRAEEAARHRAMLLDWVLEALPHGVCVYGPDKRVATFNEAYARIMEGAGVSIGDHADVVIARRVAEGEYDNAYARYTWERSFGPRPRMDDTVRRRPNGTVISVRAAPLPDGGYISVVTDVTALHAAQDAAEERATLLDAVLDALPDGVVVYGPDGRARITNPAYRAVLGDAAVRIGESFEELAARHIQTGEQSPDLAQDLVRRHYGPVEAAARPIRRVRPDGSAVVTRAGRLPDGGRIVVVSDVTALHKAEQELSRRAALLEASLSAMRHGIAVFGPDRRLLAWNAQVAALTGVPPDMYFAGASFDAIVDTQVELGVLSAERGRSAKAVDRSRPHRHLRVSEGLVVEVISDPTPDGGFVVTYADVTALHRAEEALRQRAAMQAAMLGNIRHGIVLYGPDRRVLLANAKTAQLTGHPSETLTPGRLMEDLLDEQVARGEIPAEAAARIKAMDRSRPQRYTRPRPDGGMLEIVCEPTPDGGFVTTYTDISEERRIRAELERARAQAETAAEAKSRFLATMSHELRTPLNAVIGLSEAIALEPDRARTEEYAAMINEAGRQLLHLVDDILDVARSETGTLRAAAEPISPAEVLREAAAEAAPVAAAGGLTLSLDLPPALPMLRGDAHRLRQVVDKLLSNAVKFTPSGGKVTVSAGACDGGFAIRVADTGIGIPREERERMFEPFTQLDNSLTRRFQGSGLGLHLARSLAVALGGTLTLEEPEGPGTVAVLRFPPARVLPQADSPAG